jgi:hypothetical protein
MIIYTLYIIGFILIILIHAMKTILVGQYKLVVYLNINGCNYIHIPVYMYLFINMHINESVGIYLYMYTKLNL